MKRLGIVVLSVMLFVLPLTMSASSNQYEVYANKLATVGVFKGTGNGYELERAPSRIEGIIMLIRLLGKEDDALAIPAGESVFDDVPGWAVQYTNYAYNNGLTNGIGNNMFGSDLAINADSYYTYLLRALGYDDSEGDFSWNTAVDFAYGQEMIADELYNQLKEDVFLRGHVAKCSYDTLYIRKKGSSDTLLDFLVASGDIDDDIADDLEFVEVVIESVDKEAERVIIANNGPTDVDICGWIIVSVKGNQTFEFPAGTVISSGQSISITSGGGVGTGDFDMAETTIWNNSRNDNGELWDDEGNLVDTWTDPDPY